MNTKQKRDEIAVYTDAIGMAIAQLAAGCASVTVGIAQQQSARDALDLLKQSIDQVLLHLEDAQKTLAVADDTLEGRDNQLKDTMRERNLAFLLIGQQVVEDILTEPVALCEVSI